LISAFNDREELIYYNISALGFVLIKYWQPDIDRLFASLNYLKYGWISDKLRRLLLTGSQAH
jgi:hypothetical protein